MRGLEQVQAAQREYDAAMWDISEPEHANLRHLHLHLSITVGKLARLLEPHDHLAHRGEDVPSLAPADLEPIVADLVMHAAQIANQLKFSLGEAFAARYRRNAERFAPESELKRFGL